MVCDDGKVGVYCIVHKGCVRWCDNGCGTDIERAIKRVYSDGLGSYELVLSLDNGGGRACASGAGLSAVGVVNEVDHRGAVGADPLVGDGAGCMIQTPNALLRDWARKTGVDLPEPGHYAVAMCFLPQNQKARHCAVKRLGHFHKVEGPQLGGWR